MVDFFKFFKSKKDQADALIQTEKLKLDKAEVEIKAEKENVKLAADKVEKDNKLQMELFKELKNN